MTTSDIALPPWIGVAVFTCVCGAALWKGGWQERLVAAGLVLGWAITALVRDYSYTQPQWGGFAVTVVNLVLFMAVALRSRKSWPLWAAGFQLLAVITHGARIVDPTVGAWAYITAGVIWTYCIMAALGVGVWGCVRRAGIE